MRARGHRAHTKVALTHLKTRALLCVCARRGSNGSRIRMRRAAVRQSIDLSQLLWAKISITIMLTAANNTTHARGDINKLIVHIRCSGCTLILHIHISISSRGCLPRTWRINRSIAIMQIRSVKIRAICELYTHTLRLILNIAHIAHQWAITNDLRICFLFVYAATYITRIRPSIGW